MVNYGLTWWGEQWLNALSYIDYSNRLPRGRSYANKGAVLSIDFNENIITARVKGSYNNIYRVAITVPKFTNKDKKLIMDYILSDNYILTSLLNRDLPQDLYDFTEQNGIRIFPESWRSFRMSCSCPDSANPCKHIAAVIYLMANEIDKNPFLVFNLHNFDILDELNKRNMTVESDGKDKIPDIPSLFPLETPPEGNSLDDDIFNSIDFTKIYPLKEELLSLMVSEQLFFQGNIKKSLEMMYKKTMRFIKINSYYFETKYEIPYDSGIRIIINENYKVSDVIFHSETYFHKTEHIIKLMNYLDKIEYKNIKFYTDDVIALYLLFNFSKFVVQNSAFIPQQIKTDKDQYTIRWIPAIINEDVNNILNQISDISPSGIIFFQPEEKISGNSFYQSLHAQAVTISSLFISQIVNDSIDKNRAGYYLSNVFDMFFFQKNTNFMDFTDKEVPHLIQLWLNKFYIAYKDFAPVISIEEDDKKGSRFNLRILIENRNEPLEQPADLFTFINDKKNSKNKYSILKDIAQIAEYFPDLKTIIIMEKDFLQYNNSEFTSILLQIIPVLKLFGLKILLPNSLKHLVKPKPTLQLSKKSEKPLKSFMDLDSLLNFEWQVAIGDESVSFDDFMKHVGKMSGLIKYKDRYILLDEKELEQLKKSLEDPPSINSKELLKSALSGEYNEAKISVTSSVLKIIRELTEINDIAEPKGLNADLRHYQKSGYSWLYKNTHLGFGSLIADDMGLGKTIQVLTLLLKFKEEGSISKEKSLIIVPTTLLTNWINEIAKFTPDLKAYVYHGINRKFPKDEYDVIITTYGTVRNDIETIKKQKFYSVIIDEAQNIKNPETSQTKAIKQIKSKVKFAMSGTPVENRLSEYWSIFDFVNKGYLGNLNKFKKEYVTPIQQKKDSHKLDNFRKITQPFFMRRLKTDKTIISDLPDKIENNQFCSLTKDQTAMYKELVESTLKIIAGSEGIERKGLVLKLMTSLKQICNHPNHYLKKSKAQPDKSGKMQLLFNLLDNILENNEKTLIFSQYKEMGELLSEAITLETGIKPLFMHGGVSRKKRDEMVTKFQEDKSKRIFILSLKAGGTGLNLTSASNVIHYDLWWNPAVEAQATDRAFRIGQTKNVMVYRLLSKGTIEERIDLMIKSKRELAELTLTTGEHWIGDLSDNELQSLVKLSN